MAKRQDFEISVKGLYIDESDRILITYENNGYWELPGGGLEKDEGLIDCLHREFKEELAVEVEVLDERPLYVWIGKTSSEKNRLMIIYSVKPKSFNFTFIEDIVSTRMVTKEELKQLKLVPQLEKLKTIL
jgi:8-oxo-dGTP pyrophosphatase MutT (NUDIX family)